MGHVVAPGGGGGGKEGHGVEDFHQSGENTILPVLVKNICRWVSLRGAIAIMLVNNQVSCVIRAWGNCCISCLECEETAACLLFPSIHELSIVSATRRDSSPKLRQFIHLVAAAHETEKKRTQVMLRHSLVLRTALQMGPPGTHVWAWRRLWVTQSGWLSRCFPASRSRSEGTSRGRHRWTPAA